MTTKDAKPDYKESLNLPKTAFPMKARLPQREPEILQLWQQHQLYNTLRQQRQSFPKFIFHDGPPYANGAIHLGHAINKTLKDIVVRSRSLSGLDAHFIPGWDCHGLPIELNVEKRLGKVGESIEAAEFRAACRAYAQEQINLQREDFIRLGVNADWENPYITMDPKIEAGIVRAFGKLWDSGHIVKGLKPVYWCTHCRSTLAEAEVEYHDHTSSAVDVRFDADAARIAECFGIAANALPAAQNTVALVIWTTTPWTLPANRAIAVHPEVRYQLLRTDRDELWVLATDLAEAVLQRAERSCAEVLGEVAGTALEGQTARHPFLDRDALVCLGDYVTTEAGTGLVHSAPAHGMDDFMLGQKYNLSTDTQVGEDGVFAESDAPYSQLDVFAANAPIVELLRNNDKLIAHENYPHSYPYCWRHREPVIYRATSQWFITMEHDELRTKTLEHIGTVQWFPDWGRARIESMVSERPDWCISRQRSWGVPLPLFVHKKTGEVHPRSGEIIPDIADAIERDGGIDAFYSDSTRALLGADADDYRPLGYILDVWFDSGTTHETVLPRHNVNTADLYLEGSDQHRGWFQSSLLTSVALRDQPPYRQVLTHGFVVDGDGRKMSKSLGNSVSPQEIIDRYGADVLRLWIATTDYRNEMVLSDEILGHVVDIYRRIRNTARFLLGNLNDFDPLTDTPAADDMVQMDRWIMFKCAQLQQQITSDYNTYQFHTACQRVHNFCATELGSFYLDIIKDRLYTCATESTARRSAQAALQHILESLVMWIAPVLAFTAEEIWQSRRGESAEFASVHSEQWKSQAEAAGLDEDLEYWEWLGSVRDCVNRDIEAMRKDGKIGSALEVKVTLHASEPVLEKLKALDDELKFVLICSATAVELAKDPAQLNELGIAVQVERIDGQKCPRCWHICATLEKSGICARCGDNLGAGETRSHA